MKKSIVLIGILSAFLLAINITSCNGTLTPRKPKGNKLELDSTSQYYDQNYRIYTLEGCEYIVGGYGKTQWGSHKGNCKNPIHREKSDTLSLQEKHFNCSVVECTKEKDGTYAITTECGILFYTEHSKKVGSVLKGFVSPKHK
jgi:hypothetical protein